MDYAAEYGHLERLEEYPPIRARIETVKIGMTALNSCYAVRDPVVKAISTMEEKDKLSILQNICSHPKGHTLFDHNCDTILSENLLSQACSPDGFTPLMIAVKFQQEKCVKHLLSKKFCSRPILEIISTDFKRTVLHICAEHPNESITKMLLQAADEYGIKLESPDIFGNTLLHICAGKNDGNTDMCKRLFDLYKKKGKCPKNIFDSLTKRNNAGSTPFHLATENGHNEMVEYMLGEVSQFEISLIEYCDQQLRTSLHIAAFNGI